jgi:hypothetical protein
MTRQKNVFTDNREIAHKWFHQTQDSARNPQGNFYFQGATIYSYGSHFPIAIIVRPKKGKGKGQKTVLFTSRNYSPTTSQHKRNVWCAMRPLVCIGNGNAKIFKVANPSLSNERLIEAFSSQIENAQDKIVELPKGTRQTTKLRLFQELQGIVANANEWAEWFGVQKRWTPPVDLETFTAKHAMAMRKAQAELAVQRMKERQEAQAKKQARYDELLQGWLAGDDVRLWGNYEISGLEIKTAHLRLSPTPDSDETENGQEIETSLGARFPLSDGVKAIRMIQSLMASRKIIGWSDVGSAGKPYPLYEQSGVLYQRNGHSIHLGDYVIDSVSANGTIKAGCHTVTPEEFNRFAGLLAEKGLL